MHMQMQIRVGIRVGIGVGVGVGVVMWVMGVRDNCDLLLGLVLD